ncbi:unnamed protein product [Oppiella nova]|uniref:TIL domain-containing protein n=1 Tax=Oppiella nova TaxID=334625 RepID=A0A7R9QXB5_9ACAR|nr:unnamed protein product [Oppiella nova]CAG2179073.1 unnamed protein product [Oppiella nova]
MSACPPTCANPNGPLCKAIIAKPGCVCISGTVRETTNNDKLVDLMRFGCHQHLPVPLRVKTVTLPDVGPSKKRRRVSALPALSETPLPESVSLRVSAPTREIGKRQTPICGSNESYSTFSPVCYYTCAHPTGVLCQGIIRKAGCVCISGTVRDTVNNVCVQPADCP